MSGIVRIISAHKFLFIALVIAVTSISVAIALSMTPVYRAEAVLAPVEDSDGSGLLPDSLGQVGSLAALAGVSLEGSGARVHQDIALLKSYGFLSRFVEDRQLLPVLFWRDWDQESASWKDEPRTLWDAYRLITEKVLFIDRDPLTGIVVVSAESHDPVVAADWVNSLVDRLNAETRERAVKEADLSISYLREELEKTSIVGVQQALFRLIEQQLRRSTLARAREQYAFRVIDRATPPAADDPVRPNRPLVVALGFTLAILTGTFLTVLRHAAKR